MLKVLRCGAAGLESTALAPGKPIPDDVVWIELVSPTREEELEVERALGVEIPTPEEMAEIEPSSRLYQHEGNTFLTSTVLDERDDHSPYAVPVSFVLTGSRLITVRYADPKSFQLFSAQAERQPHLCISGAHVLIGLIEAIVDRLADTLEHTAADVETASAAIFYKQRGGSFRPLLEKLGAAQTINSKVRESLVSFARLISFAMLADQIETDKDLRDQLKSAQRDVQSLTDHASYISSNITFLLDAALGFINIEQNDINKIFSVAALVFLPPTLIAGIYGMNFHLLPELTWPFGYPMALILMLSSAVLPYLWFRKKGYL